MRFVNRIRLTAGLGKLQFNECLAKLSNRMEPGHDNFGIYKPCDPQCTYMRSESALGTEGDQ